jgi:hypothetical protein
MGHRLNKSSSGVGFTRKGFVFSMTKRGKKTNKLFQFFWDEFHNPQGAWRRRQAREIGQLLARDSGGSTGTHRAGRAVELVSSFSLCPPLPQGQA